MPFVGKSVELLVKKNDTYVLKDGTNTKIYCIYYIHYNS